MTYKVSGGEFLVNATTAGDQYLNDILALPGSKYAGAFDSYDLAGRYATKVRIFDGGVPGAEKSLTPGANLAALSDGRVIAVSGDATTVTAQFLTSKLGRAGTAVTIATAASGWSIEPGTAKVVALADGGFAALWKTTDALYGIDTIYGQSFDAQGKAIAEPLRIADGYNQILSDINVSLLASGAIAVFMGTTISVFEPDFQSGTIVRVLDDHLGYTGAFHFGVAGLANGNLVITWAEHVKSGSSIVSGPIHAQIFTPSGTPIAEDFLIDPAGRGYGVDIAVLASGDFAVVWKKAGTDSDIAIRTFTADGIEIGFEQIVNSTKPGQQFAPSITALPDGGFVVGWSDRGQSAPDTSGSAVRAQVFSSNAGQVYEGNSGVDKLNGTAKDDTLIGLEGDDMLNGKVGNDTASYAAASAAVSVNLALTTMQNTGGAGRDTLLAIENLEGSRFGDTLRGDARSNVLTGGGGADRLYGEAGIDRLVGGTGADLLDGGRGADAMIGGIGNDTYCVDNKGDQVIESSASDPASGRLTGGTDRLIASVDYTMPMFVETLILAQGAGAIDGIGNGYANTIIGNESDNFIWGGGSGADRLTGGLGADTFKLNYVTGSAVPIITDFTPGTDRLLITANPFFAFYGREGQTLTDADLALGPRATTPDQHLIYYAKTGTLYYDPDGVGGQAQTKLAAFFGHPDLHGSDFGVIAI